MLYDVSLPTPALPGSGSMGVSQRPVGRTPASGDNDIVVSTELTCTITLNMDNKLQFERPLVLLGGGDCDVCLLQRLLDRGWPLVVADGGANRLVELNIVPAAIIGDLDSLQKRQYWERRCQVLLVSEQDTTDFEKCLYSTQAPIFVAMGFTGKRFDHTLAALNAMLRYADSKNVVLISESDVIVVRSGDYRVNVPVGTRFSIFPLSRVEFAESKGLEYSLNNLLLQQGKLVGCSNRVVSSEVMLRTADEGTYSVIVPLNCLDTIIGDGMNALDKAGMSGWLE